jgi:tetratricopeptide (TPR) repeat protein
MFPATVKEAAVMATRSGSVGYFRFLAALGFAAVALFAVGCTADVKDIRAEGIEQFRSRQYVESMATLRHGLDLNPNDAQSNYYMGLNYQANAARKFRDGDVAAARRELDTAIVYFTQAVKSWPNYMAAVSAKVEALELRGKYDEALAVAERVADNNRGAAAHFIYLGNEYRDRADYDNALRAYKIALSTDPNSSKAYAEMAKMYLRIGDTALASDSYQRAQEINPSEPALADYMAQMNGSFERAASPPPSGIAAPEKSNP